MKFFSNSCGKRLTPECQCAHSTFQIVAKLKNLPGTRRSSGRDDPCADQSQTRPRPEEDEWRLPGWMQNESKFWTWREGFCHGPACQVWWPKADSHASGARGHREREKDCWFRSFSGSVWANNRLLVMFVMNGFVLFFFCVFISRGFCVWEGQLKCFEGVLKQFL